MMRVMKVLLATTLLTVPVGALSRVPYSPPGSADAHLRLSWRTTVSANERCRTRTQEELDALPVHMRTPQVCEPDDANYLLITVMDGGPADTAHLLRGGVKGDRPLFVLEEHTLEPGVHSIRVRLERAGGSARTETLEALDTTVSLEAGRIALVTSAGEGQGLTVRQ